MSGCNVSHDQLSLDSHTTNKSQLELQCDLTTDTRKFYFNYNTSRDVTHSLTQPGVTVYRHFTLRERELHDLDHVHDVVLRSHSVILPAEVVEEHVVLHEVARSAEGQGCSHEDLSIVDGIKLD